MSFFKLDCLGGQAEILAFSDTFAKYKELLKNDQVVFISGKPTDENDFSDLKLIAEEIVSIDLAREIFSKNVNISIGIDNQNSQLTITSSTSGEYRVVVVDEECQVSDEVIINFGKEGHFFDFIFRKKFEFFYNLCIFIFNNQIRNFLIFFYRGE